MRVFAVIPRSNSQTSPRRGGIYRLVFFPVQKGKKRATRLAYFVVGDRAGIEREVAGAPQHFDDEGLLFGGWQGLEGAKEFQSVGAHVFRLANSAVERNDWRAVSRLLRRSRRIRRRAFSGQEAMIAIETPAYCAASCGAAGG